jgi:GLPGLI family protein
MKKNIKICGFLCCIYFFIGTGKSQTYEVTGLVDFRFTHVLDTNDRSKLNIENMRLFVNKEISMYRNLDKMKFENSISDKINESLSNGNSSHINLGTLPRGTNYIFYNYISENKNVASKFFADNVYFIADTIPIKWNVQNDTITFLGYKCQIANCFFKGRYYTVYFTKDLPYFTGPWKLRGLPGLILKAFDNKYEVTFEAVNVDFTTKSLNFSIPEKPIYTSTKELNRAIEGYRQNPDTQQDGIAIKISNSSVNPSSKIKKKVTNPVELSSH